MESCLEKSRRSDRKKVQEIPRTTKDPAIVRRRRHGLFQADKNYLSKQKPKPFDVLDMYPGQSEQDVAELLADHFNAISNKFSPIDYDHDIPKAPSKPIKNLCPHEVAIRLKKFKKPKSMVRGDLFPDLVSKYADQLAVPLTAIYNEITESKIWPRIWKNESVTIIPKTRTPSDIRQLRNISCTMLAQKSMSRLS